MLPISPLLRSSISPSLNDYFALYMTLSYGRRIVPRPSLEIYSDDVYLQLVMFHSLISTVLNSPQKSEKVRRCLSWHKGNRIQQWENLT